MIKNALRAGAYLHHLEIESENPGALAQFYSCLLYTSDAADEGLV